MQRVSALVILSLLVAACGSSSSSSDAGVVVLADGGTVVVTDGGLDLLPDGGTRIPFDAGMILLPDGGPITSGVVPDGGPQAGRGLDGGISSAGVQTCTAVVAAFNSEATDYAPCATDGGSPPITGPTQSECEQDILSCSGSDLAILNSFASCISGVGACSSSTPNWTTSVQSCGQLVVGDGGVSTPCLQAVTSTPDGGS